MLDVQYPSYEKVIPCEDDTHGRATFDRAALLDTLRDLKKRTGKMDCHKKMTLSAAAGLVRLWTHGEEVSCLAVVPFTGSLEPFACNMSYLTDAVATSTSEHVTITQFQGGFSPVHHRPFTVSANDITPAIVMPMGEDEFPAAPVEVAAQTQNAPQVAPVEVAAQAEPQAPAIDMSDFHTWAASLPVDPCAYGLKNIACNDCGLPVPVTLSTTAALCYKCCDTSPAVAQQQQATAAQVAAGVDIDPFAPVEAAPIEVAPIETVAPVAIAPVAPIAAAPVPQCSSLEQLADWAQSYVAQLIDSAPHAARKLQGSLEFQLQRLGRIHPDTWQKGAKLAFDAKVR